MHIDLAQELSKRRMNTTSLAVLHFAACQALEEPLPAEVERLLRYESYGALGRQYLGVAPTKNDVYMKHLSSIPDIDSGPDIGSETSTEYVLDNLDELLASKALQDDFLTYAEKHWVEVRRDDAGRPFEIRLRGKSEKG